MSNEAKFTKGEWQLEEADFDGEFLLTTQRRMDNSQVEILTIDTSYLGDIGKEQRANAHLIAAAPEMYEMIERITANYQESASVAEHEGYETKYAQDKIFVDALLAKARGE